MREEDLRRVLLVKAIEDTDSDGLLIPAADRIAAARDAKREAPGASEEELLAARAKTLLTRLAVRHPFVDTVSALAAGPAWVGWLLVALALILGVGLSALDGTRRINVLAFPLLGLVLWNLAVYGAIAAAAWRGPGPRRRWLPELLAYAGVAEASRLVAGSRAFHTALSEALARFVREWYEAAKPLLLLRATRTFHLCAAAVGIGLIVGLYLRGIAFDYRAGWESTFLDARQVRAALVVFYGPASLATGIPLPDAAHLEAIRWRNGGGGENAAPWIHLLAASAALFVVVPRLLLALLATVGITRLSLRAPVPPQLLSHFRRTFGAAGLVEPGVVRLVPYAYEAGEAALARLRSRLPAELGDHLALDLRPTVPYGEEDAFLAAFRGDAGTAVDAVVLLMSLAATPEEESHGTFIAGVRDVLAARMGTQLLVLVDEGPYAARMSAGGGAPERVAERRKVWQDFIAAHGAKARFADYSS
jgi:hypothetical protein